MVAPMKPAIFLALPILLGGCEMTAADGNAASTPAPGAFAQGSPEMRGENFARNRCADCHAVGRLQTSPVPTAPGFEAVANTPGLTKETLTQWLNTSHDYPREMYFEIPAEHIDDLVAYMLTLRSENYEPTIGVRTDLSPGGRTAAAVRIE